MNHREHGDASDDMLALMQTQLEARRKVTVGIESTVLITTDLAALAWLEMPFSA